MPPLKKKIPISKRKGKKRIKKKSAVTKRKKKTSCTLIKKKIKKKANIKSVKQLAFLTVLGNTKNKRKRDLLIEYAGKEDLDAICQCIFNVLTGNLKLNSTSHSKLKKYKSTLRYLINRRVNNKKRKAVLKQKGGFLSLLIPLAVSLIGGLAGAK